MAAAQAKFSGGYDARNAQRWNEVEKRNNTIRLNWFQKNYDRIYENTKKAEIPSQAKELLKELADKRCERIQTEPRHNTKKVGFPDLPSPDIKINLRPMKPIEPAVRKILYHGISKNNEGRELYLNTRYKPKAPCERYYFPETTSFLYGWQGNELGALLNNEPRRGKVAIIKESFYSNTGVQADLERSREPFMGYCCFPAL